MSDPRIVRANERYKAVANVLWTLGAGLLAAAIVQGYSAKALSFELLGWLFAAGVLMWVGWLVLGLLDSES